MQYKLSKFLEWFYMNENAISELVNLRAEKKLFWLHWIQWHLDFYLPGTCFFLNFPQKNPMGALCLFRERPFPALGQQVVLRKFRLDFAPGTKAVEGVNAFEGHIIWDIEPLFRPVDENDKTIFSQTEFKDAVIFGKYAELPAMLNVISNEKQPEGLDVSLPILVRLANANVLGDMLLVRLVEFDHYMDVLNKAASHDL